MFAVNIQLILLRQYLSKIPRCVELPSSFYWEGQVRNGEIFIYGNLIFNTKREQSDNGPTEVNIVQHI